MIVKAVYRARQYLCASGFSRSARAAEKIRVSDFTGNNLVFKSFCYMRLSDNIFKYGRPPFSVNSLMCRIKPPLIPKNAYQALYFNKGSDRVYRNTLRTLLSAAWFPI